MIYRLLFKFLILTFLFLSIANVVVTSSGRMQVGTPKCQIYNEQSGRKCARLYCDATGVTLSSSDTCYDNNGNITRPSEQYDLICEPTPPCRVIVTIYCNQDNRSAEYEKECNGRRDTVSSRYIYCPLSCTCSAPQGRKPCDRATWNKTTCDWNISRCRDIGGGCGELFTPTEEESSKGQSELIPPDPSCCSDSERLACIQGGGTWDESSCSCLSPIVIDTAGNGFNLTNAGNGVLFDITNDGVKEKLSWTAASSDDAWLALDRNGNGGIDDGRELFGSSTFQPYPAEGETKNGFRALAVYDKPAQGGNNDNQIDSGDAVFNRLKLWRDLNHNGISEANELQSLTDSDIRVIELDYRESRRQDEHGNWFRFRAKMRDARGAQVGRWAWDVFLSVQPSGN